MPGPSRSVESFSRHALRRCSNPMPINVPNHNRNTDRIQGGMLIVIRRDPQLAETTMSPEKRTLLQVRLEDAVESEEIFSTLMGDRKSTRLNSSHRCISYAVFCLK